ncbi:MAG: DUF1801 domain-containing protein [Xanthomonadales bacterium]|jgi:hypothetical protein|nr:DUF1801 domain-containing protein [Xanthomonadales bacterium]
MAKNKTVETQASVDAFIEAVDDESRRSDSRELVVLMQTITGHEAKMWGPSMVGFGAYHYRYASGREGDYFITGFSPRKTALSVYVMPGLERYEKQLARLGPHKTGKSCLYLKSLDTIDRDVLKEIISDSVRVMHEQYDCR